MEDGTGPGAFQPPGGARAALPRWKEHEPGAHHALASKLAIPDLRLRLRLPPFPRERDGADWPELEIAFRTASATLGPGVLAHALTSGRLCRTLARCGYVYEVVLVVPCMPGAVPTSLMVSLEFQGRGLG